MMRILIAAVILAIGTWIPTLSSAATTEMFDEKQEKAIEQIIRSYLLANPGLLDEVILELRKKREEEAALARREHLKELYKPASKYGKYAIGNGDIVVVEFMDYNCPFCRQAYSVMRELKDEANIEVRFVEFPVVSPTSVTAAQAAIASEKQGKYIEYHDAMMELEDGIESEDTIFRIAKEVGLDIDQLKKDMKAPETQTLLQENFALAEQLGVQGTPAIFVGDNTYIVGAHDGLKEELRQAIADTRANCVTC